MMKDLLHTSALFDLYGSLLTEKQRQCLTMHLFEDFSLSEIGDAMKISRQAAHDMIKRSEFALSEYEEKLGFLQKLSLQRAAFDHILLYVRNAHFQDKKEQEKLVQAILPFTTFEQEDKT